MSELHTYDSSPRFDASAYAVEIAHQAQALPDGIQISLGGNPAHPTETLHLEWKKIRSALVADVGEPEGVMTVIVDLVVLSDPGALRIYRFDADIGEPARDLGKALLAGLSASRASDALRMLAANGLTGRWVPDLDGLDEENAALIDACVRAHS